MEYNEQSNIGTNPSMANSGHFRDYEFMPAVIIENNDPLNYNRIKVTAPGTFNGNNTDIELLPWCYPWFMFGNATYSTMEKGSKVWLIKNKKRIDECWYLPMHELCSSAQEYIEQHADENPEVLMHSNDGGEVSSITYNDNDGYTITSGGSTINTSNGGGTSVKSGGSEVNIYNNGNVTIGPSDIENGEPMVLGETLYIKLVELAQVLYYLISHFSDIPSYNADVALSLSSQAYDCSQSMGEILSETVCISERHYEAEQKAESERSTTTADLSLFITQQQSANT